MEDENNDEIIVIASEEGMVRDGYESRLKVGVLAANVKKFLNQMSRVLDESPDTLGRFNFEEFEVYAEVNAEGTLALLGTGGSAGTMGGVKFIFRRH